MAKQSRQVFSDINITPLTDIFLVLLIIMMVIAPLLDQQGLSLTVPENVEAEQVKEHKTINITIDDQDKFFINNEEIAADNLENIIREQAKINPEGVVIQTSEESTNGAMVKVMDSARNAGVTAISVSEM